MPSQPPRNRSRFFGIDLVCVGSYGFLCMHTGESCGPRALPHGLLRLPVGQARFSSPTYVLRKVLHGNPSEVELLGRGSVPLRALQPRVRTSFEAAVHCAAPVASAQGGDEGGLKLCKRCFADIKASANPNRILTDLAHRSNLQVGSAAPLVRDRVR